jgi:hypothetical protein
MYDDYRDYFFATIKREIGTPCPDWKQVIEDCTRMNPPFGINPAPGYVQPLDAPHHAITIMIDAGGNARGRMWLPTDLPVYDSNGNAWYTHEMQMIDNGPEGLIWAWLDKGGAPVRQFSGSAVPPGEIPVPPPTGDFVTRDEMNQAIAIAVAECLKRGDMIGLQTLEWDGREPMFVCADREKKETPLLANRQGQGSWETFTIK